MRNFIIDKKEKTVRVGEDGIRYKFDDEGEVVSADIAPIKERNFWGFDVDSDDYFKLRLEYKNSEIKIIPFTVTDSSIGQIITYIR